jgi:hypothetical protein
MSTTLPTLSTAGWTITGLHDSIHATLGADRGGQELSLFQYAVTESGWDELRATVRRWMRAKSGRKVVAYVGTDHGLTDPDALELMQKDGVDVRLLVEYQGIFHPKVAWLAGRRHVIWVGSNNLTRNGLLNNIEFAIQLVAPKIPNELLRWAQEVELASKRMDASLLASYRKERAKFAAKRSTAGTFTWSRRKERASATTPQSHRGDLVIEIMPRETGSEGKQVQIPVEAAVQFFGIRNAVGATQKIQLRPTWGAGQGRSLTMRIFSNSTVRLSIAELDYRDRPCVILFRRKGKSTFTFDIIAESVFPDTYRALIAKCGKPTRQGSRRWTIVQ